jgi:hypothetical protein
MLAPRSHAVAILWALHSAACASQRSAGEALVVTGAAVATIGATAASNTFCGRYGCYSQNSKGSGAAKAALAGVAIAAAGYALMESARQQDRALSSPAHAPTPSATPTCCRLVRKDPPAQGDDEDGPP